MDPSNYTNFISSRVSSTSRPYDFICDNSYAIATAKNFNRFAEDAIRKTSEQEVRPVYDRMFSSSNRYPTMRHILRTEEIPITWEEKFKKQNERPECYNVSGRDQIKYISKADNDLITRIKLENFTKTETHKILINGFAEEQNVQLMRSRPCSPKPTPRFATKSTQTDYRDSETQTDPWTPLYSTSNYKIPHILSRAAWEPLIAEVDTTEEETRLNDLEHVLSSTNKRNLRAQIELTRKIEHTEWMIKEKRIDYVNNTRMELVAGVLYKHTIDSQITISKREQLQRRAQDELKNKKLQSLVRHKEREIRKLEEKHRQFLTSYTLFPEDIHLEGIYKRQLYKILTECRKED